MKIKFINPAVIVAAMLVSIGFCRSEALDPTAFTKRMPITRSSFRRGSRLGTVTCSPFRRWGWCCSTAPCLRGEFQLEREV